jgi:hypothetical protein
MTDDIRWRAKKYLWKRMNRTEIALRKARMKKGAEREVQDLEYKMQVLKYLEDLVLRDMERPAYYHKTLVMLPGDEILTGGPREYGKREAQAYD